ncbi:hypothetical protein GCM10027037_05800 [Mucilaginibacter koreensis]
MDQQYHAVLTYSAFYPQNDIPEKNVERLDGLNRDVVFNLFCRLKMTLSRSSERDINNPFINWFVSKLPDSHGERFRHLVFDGFPKHFLTTPLIVNQILVDLFQKTETSLEPMYERPDYIALAVLETIMIYNEHHFRQIGIGEKSDTHDLLWQIMMMQDMNGANSSSFVRTGGMKQAIFIDFLEQITGTGYPAFEKAICEMLGINKLGDVSLLYLALQIEQDKRIQTSDPLICIPPEDPIHQTLYNLNLVLEPGKNDVAFSVFDIMMKPFIRLSNGNLSFTGTHDLSLISELGWGYFLFKEGSLSSYIPQFSKSSFQAFFGYYVEKFLLGKVFQSFHQKGYRVIPSDDKKTPDMTLILNETDIFIIEIKTSTVHYKDWQEQNLNAFKKYLNDNFISDKKGVVQLHKCLQHLSDHPKELFEISIPLKKLKIYPIIIYSEPHAGVVAVNDFIINNGPELSIELSSKFKAILPVTMISCDFFLENSKLLSKNKRLLKDAILRYHKGTRERKKQWLKVNSTANFSKAMADFDNYSIGFEGIYKEDQLAIADQIKAIFNQTK